MCQQMLRGLLPPLPVSVTEQEEQPGATLLSGTVRSVLGCAHRKGSQRSLGIKQRNEQTRSIKNKFREARKQGFSCSFKGVTT